MINRKNRTTMKLRKYLAVLAVAAFASLATSCAEAEDEFIHTDSTINSIEIQPAEATLNYAISDANPYRPVGTFVYNEKENCGYVYVLVPGHAVKSWKLEITYD